MSIQHHGEGCRGGQERKGIVARLQEQAQSLAPGETRYVRFSTWTRVLMIILWPLFFPVILVLAAIIATSWALWIWVSMFSPKFCYTLKNTKKISNGNPDNTPSRN
jgi:hypothetical protein